MRFSLIALALVFPLTVFGQEANTSVLTLIEPGDFNQMKVEVVVILGNSSDISALSGTVTVLLDIDPITGKTGKLTIRGADISGSDIKLANGNFVGNYHFESSGLGLSALTAEPPGEIEGVDPTGDSPAQEFNAEQHTFILNEGNLGGRVNSIIGDPVDIDYDYASDPFEGSGTGTGNVIVIPAGYAGGKLLYEITLTLPISLAQEIAVEGSSLSADVTLGGTLKAIGTTFLQLPDYDEWALMQGIAEGSEGDFSLSAGAPNLHLFGLGFEAASAPDQLLVYRPDGLVLKTAGRFARGDFELQWSSDLEHWVRIPDAEMVNGSSRISEGDEIDEEIVAGLGTGVGPRFYRLAVLTEE